MCSSRRFQRAITFTPVLICSLFQCIYILLCTWLSSLKTISWLLFYVSWKLFPRSYFMAADYFIVRKDCKLFNWSPTDARLACFQCWVITLNIIINNRVRVPLQMCAASNVCQWACRQIPTSGTTGWDVARSTHEGKEGGQIALAEAVSSSPPSGRACVCLFSHSFASTVLYQTLWALPIRYLNNGLSLWLEILKQQLYQWLFTEQEGTVPSTCCTWHYAHFSQRTVGNR